jgi:hypothetical protein
VNVHVDRAGTVQLSISKDTQARLRVQRVVITLRGKEMSLDTEGEMVETVEELTDREINVALIAIFNIMRMAATSPKPASYEGRHSPYNDEEKELVCAGHGACIGWLCEIAAPLLEDKIRTERKVTIDGS